MLKILQGATVALVTIILLTGLGIVLFKPDAIGTFVQYVPVATNILIPEIAAAFLGKPLKEFVAIQREKANGVSKPLENIGG
jgi:hypothetical protein